MVFRKSGGSGQEIPTRFIPRLLLQLGSSVMQKESVNVTRLMRMSPLGHIPGLHKLLVLTLIGDTETGYKNVHVGSVCLPAGCLPAAI